MSDLHHWSPYGGSPRNEWACWRCGTTTMADADAVTGLCPGQHLLSTGAPKTAEIPLNDDQITVLLHAARESIADRPSGPISDCYSRRVVAGRDLIRLELATQVEGATGWVYLRATEAGRQQLHVRGLLSGAPAPSTSWIKPGVMMRHHSGRLYEVLDVSNLDTTDSVKFPVTVHYRGTNGMTWSRSIASMAGKFTPARTATFDGAAGRKPLFKQGDTLWHRGSGHRYTVRGVRVTPRGLRVVAESSNGMLWIGFVPTALKTFTPAGPGDIAFEVSVASAKAVLAAPEPKLCPGDVRWRRDTGLRFEVLHVTSDREGAGTLVLMQSAAAEVTWSGPIGAVARDFTDVQPAKLGTLYWRRDTGRQYVLVDRRGDTVRLVRDDGIRWIGPERLVAEVFYDYAPTHWLENIGSRVKTPVWSVRPEIAGAGSRDGVDAVVPLAWGRGYYNAQAPNEPLLEELEALRDGRWFGLVGVQASARDAVAAIRGLMAKADRLLKLARDRGDELEATHGDLKTAREKQAALAAELESMRGRKNDAYTERNRVVAALARVLAHQGYPVCVTKTDIPDWDPQWHGCVYIDGPQGQLSWHFHDDHADLFDGLPHRAPGSWEWDGHTTEQKYSRLDLIGRDDPVEPSSTEFAEHLSTIAAALSALRRQQARLDARLSRHAS